MLDILLHTIEHTIKLLPFLFVTYLVLEIIEKKAGDKTEQILKKSGQFGPVIGALLGIVPQCGFSTAASSLFSARVISIGTLISIFLSTSDEMLPILISQAAPISLIIKVILLIIFIGMIVGIIVDIFIKNKENNQSIHKICEEDHCNCEEKGIIKSSISHTLHIFLYIFIITLILNTIIHFIGEDTIANLVLNIPVVGIVISVILGLIPNCASSVILTTLYLDKIISLGSMIAGLLANSGIGLIVLFKLNKNKKENLKIVLILSIVGIISGILIDAIKII